jgi:hypothetical protein
MKLNIFILCLALSTIMTVTTTVTATAFAQTPNKKTPAGDLRKKSDPDQIGDLIERFDRPDPIADLIERLDRQSRPNPACSTEQKHASTSAKGKL